MFLAWYFIGERAAPASRRIVITPGQVERLSQAWTRTHLRPPSSEELAGLVDEEIDEEILYREAVALGLDRDDLAIRRRLAVKMEFLAEDAAAAANPSEEQLEVFLREHPDKFAAEPLTTLSQVFVSRSRRGEPATAEATHLLALLNGKGGSHWESLGDSAPFPTQFQAATAADIARHFGHEFPTKLAALPVGAWSGPVESKYGLHLILIRERQPGRIPPLKQIRESVVNEWRAAQRRQLNAAMRRHRRSLYQVKVQWPERPKETPTITARDSDARKLP